ncbi:Universal stress protein UspA-like protein [Hyella patelloides LEGE 07179]|uniref:Universal stress protein UspA-like protein n=1 Tax=Hyella patelloides LEGE 07179 TaxID=945734 RepID=A0A563VY31_9CYAN|nr:universal stress protein [Hyella patelloides]VEP16364.1 Universal stress protein UspA-like protein [Hyella patelloides LEGE 07179]
MSCLKKKSVLIPIDFSEPSYEAIAIAKEYVEDISSLKLIHVLAPLHPADPAAMWDTLNNEDRQQKVQEFLHSKLDELGYKGVEIKVTIGKPGTEIIDYAKEIDADLIVLPSHGRKAMSHFLLGSVAERVVRLSHCPVLVLK